MTSLLSDRPHRRYNLLTGEWIVVSPHRTKRPWLGGREATAPDDRPAYDPGCLLCPGNERMNGERNPAYTSTFVFDNDFSALLPREGEPAAPTGALLRSQEVGGVCRVICFSPRHDLTLAEMTPEEITAVINTWADQTTELGRDYQWVQVFENKGIIMGCSNPHPHGQIWAGDFLPNEPAKEDCAQRDYLRANGSPLLIDYLRTEVEQRERIVVENDDWVALVPYWATWPYELLVLPRRQILRLPDVTPAERASLAALLKVALCKYDNLFETSFPYSMGWHGAPFGEDDPSHWQLHAHFYPPLLRSATVKKFMVGYEMLAEAQRDITPEQAAARLRELPDAHYRTR